MSLDVPPTFLKSATGIVCSSHGSRWVVEELGNESIFLSLETLMEKRRKRQMIIEKLNESVDM